MSCVIIWFRLQTLTFNEITVSCSDTSEEEEEEEEDSELSNESNTESDNLEASRESLSSSDEITLRSKRQKEKMRRKRRRKEVLSRERAREVLVKRENELREAKLKEPLEGEPQLSQLDNDLVCPVCLDLLHEPFQVDPCDHVFCEPCLRRLGQKNPMNCSCPLCYQDSFEDRCVDDVSSAQWQESSKYLSPDKQFQYEWRRRTT